MDRMQWTNQVATPISRHNPSWFFLVGLCKRQGLCHPDKRYCWTPQKNYGCYPLHHIWYAEQRMGWNRVSLRYPESY
jgi:hypothetical protein